MVDQIAPQFSIFLGVVDYAVYTAMFSSYVGPEFIVYFADFTALIIGISSAAYVAVKTVSAAINFTMGFYYQYAGQSLEGDLMYAWELGFISLWLGWSLFVTTGAYYMAAQVYD